MPERWPLNDVRGLVFWRARPMPLADLSPSGGGLCSPPLLVGNLEGLVNIAHYRPTRVLANIEGVCYV